MPQDRWTIRRLREIYSYDPETGVFTRKEKRKGGKPSKSGEEGAVTVQGYRQLFIDGIPFLAHKLAWTYMNDDWPPKGRNLRHVNGDALDNRIANLCFAGDQELNQERLKGLLHYDPETGKFTWKVKRPKVEIGEEAGTVRSDGYRTISIDGVKQLAHRLAWIYVYGWLPKNYIDHVNRDPRDNRLENLREATASENSQNQGARSTNKTGFRGVSLYRNGKYLARLTKDGRVHTFGYFSTADEANQAIIAGEALLQSKTAQDAAVAEAVARSPHRDWLLVATPGFDTETVQ